MLSYLDVFCIVSQRFENTSLSSKAFPSESIKNMLKKWLEIVDTALFIC